MALYQVLARLIIILEAKILVLDVALSLLYRVSSVSGENGINSPSMCKRVV